MSDKQPTMLDVAHDMAKGLHDAGVINSVTMREFDAACLPETKDLSAREIQRIRKKEKVSQSVFAKILNTSSSTVKQWEQGDKHPRGTSLKLLNLVRDKGLNVLL